MTGSLKCRRKAVSFYAVTQVSGPKRWALARCAAHLIKDVQVRIGDYLVSDISLEEFMVLEVMES